MENNNFVDSVLEEIKASISGIALEEIHSFVKALDKEKRIFCDGMGRSRLQAEGFAMRLTQMGFQSIVVGEATTPAITKDDLLLICSGSGETPILVEHGIKARETGAQIFLVTATRGSSLEKLSDESIIVEASSKKKVSQYSIQPMGSLFEQSTGILCDIIVLFLMEKYKISNEEMYENHSNLE